MSPSTEIVLGAALQGVGLAFVFWEVIAIRLSEWGPPKWWTTLRAKLHKRRDAVVTAAAAVARSAGASATSAASATVTAGAPSDTERIQALEQRVGQLADRLAEVPETIDQAVAAAIARAEAGDRTIKQTMEAEKAREHRARGRSLIRQTLGAVCVGAGLIIGTIGAVNY